MTQKGSNNLYSAMDRAIDRCGDVQATRFAGRLAWQFE